MNVCLRRVAIMTALFLAANTPDGVAFDGANIWVTFFYGGQGGGNGVYKL